MPSWRSLRIWKKKKPSPPDPAQNGQAISGTQPNNTEDRPTALKVSNKKGQRGLILLNPKPGPDGVEPDGVEPNEPYSLDVVAVHGITGDAFTTWTHRNGKNWLRDFLPNKFPGARVFSYGYPADIFWSKNKGDIDSFARTLLECLKRERLQEKVDMPGQF
jgi:hypothetical protein